MGVPIPPPPPIDSTSGTPIARRWVHVTMTGRGNGTLWIYPGRLILKCDRLSSLFTGVDRLTHSARQVRLILPRLLPMFSTLILVDGNQRVAVDASSWKGRSIRQQLIAAGFDVKEEQTWVGTGLREVGRCCRGTGRRLKRSPSLMIRRTCISGRN